MKKQFKIKRLKYKNIMSVGQVPIDIVLDQHQKTLVYGKNGFGKSTIIEALTYALFGKAFRDIKNSQLINTYNKKELLVEAWLDYNGKEYYIKRGQKPNIFEVQVDGVQVDESSSVKEFQEKFEQMIGMNYNSYKQVVVLGTAGYTPFMGLTPAMRRRLVEDLLEITVLAEMDKMNKSEIRDINQNVQLTDAKIQNIKSVIQTHKDYAEKQKKLSGDNLTRLYDMYDQNLSEAKIIKADIVSTREKIEAVELEKPVYDHDRLQLLNKEINNIEQLNSASNRVIKLYHKGGDCPTCLQSLTNKELVSNIEESINANNIKSDAYQKEQRVLSDIVEQISEKDKLIRGYENDVNTWTSNVRLLVDKVKKIKSAIDQANQETIDNSDAIRAEEKKLEEEIANKSDLVMEKYERSIILDMLKDSGIKSAIVKKYIPLFNKRINHYLKLLEADYVFNLNEEFKETIKSRGREEFTYNSFSQGEKGRIDLALLFTWRDIAEIVSGIRISCLIMDEVTDTAGLDAEGYKNLTSILDSMTDFNFIVISHKEQDIAKYDRSISMRKQGRFTVMEIQ